MNAHHLVLVVADNLRRSKGVIAELEGAGYLTAQAETVSSVWRQVYEENPYAIAILASTQGSFARPLELCKELANHTSSTIILLLEAGGRRMRAQAFANGVDQCFSFPGCSPELVAYLDARIHLERQARLQPLLPTTEQDCIQVDTSNRRVYCNGRFIDLTDREWAMLMLLAHHEGQVVRFREISRNLWRSCDLRHARASLKHCIMRLRRKIESNPREPKYVVTVRGLGYRLERAVPIPLPQTGASSGSAPNRVQPLSIPP